MEGGDAVKGFLLRLAALAVFCVGVSRSQTVPDTRPQSVSYCDLLSDPQKYDKRIVATEAQVQSSEHEVHVYDSRCRSTATDNRSAMIELPEGWNSTKLGKRLSRILRHRRIARVEFEADFYDRGGPFGPEATRFRFVLQRLASVHEVPEPQSETLH